MAKHGVDFVDAIGALLDPNRIEDIDDSVGYGEEVMVAALSDPDVQSLTPGQLARMRRLPDVKALRARLGLTQEQFASSYCLPLGTVRDWEQGRTRPDAPALALLAVIDREPEIVRRALH